MNSKDKETQAGNSVPARDVRIGMVSERYEICGTLFDAVYGEDPDAAGGDDPRPVSPLDELMMGVQADEDSENGYFVKPADPSVLTARRDGEESDAIQRIELYTEGLMAQVVDPVSGVVTVSLAYDESELTGMEGAHSHVFFRSDDPGLIHMVRSGAVTTAMTFKAHHRAICTYDTPYMPFQIGIHSLVVDNRLVTDGELILDYIIEIRGARAERCSMKLTVREI